MNTTNIYTIKEILKAIEQSNKTNALCNNEHKNYILLKDNYNVYKIFYDWKSYKKFIVEYFLKEYQQQFINKTLDLSELTNTIKINNITYFICIDSEI